MNLLDELEADRICILREIVATCLRPVLMYSIGKDSATLQIIRGSMTTPTFASEPL